MMCINTKGAAELLDASRTTIWRYCVSGRFDSFAYGAHTLIPLRDVAKEAGTTQRELLEDADRLDIPVWRCKGR